MMENVLIRLQEYRVQASGAEKDLARYLPEEPEETSKPNIHAPAEKTYTSTVVVIRLYKKLGFGGYKEFNNSLNYELALRSKARKDISTKISRDGGSEDIVDKAIYGSTQALEDTCKLVDLNELQNCVDIIEKAKTVGLFGIGSSLLTVRDMYLRFPRLSKPCICNDDWHSQLVCVRSPTKEDVAVIFGYLGPTREMLTCTGVLKEQSAPITTVTRLTKDDLTRLTDCELYASAKELLVRVATTAPRMSQLNIIDILSTVYVGDNCEKNIARLKNNAIIKDII